MYRNKRRIRMRQRKIEKNYYAHIQVVAVVLVAIRISTEIQNVLCVISFLVYREEKKQ